MTTTAADEAPLCLPPRPITRPPRALMPDGAVDCHFHVFRPGAPLAVPRSYTPRMLTLDDWQAYADAAGIARGVLVQPSVYGFDNSVMLATLAEAPDNLRGIAVLDAAIPDRDLEALHSRGVRGVRCNTRHRGGLSFDIAVRFAHRIAPLGWTLHFQINAEQLETIAGLVPTLGVDVVIDHLGFVPPRPPEAALFRLRALLDTGRCYVKLSAPYRLAGRDEAAAVTEIAAGLVRTHADQLLWGSDWPHTELWKSMPDDMDIVDDLHALLGSDDMRRLILVDTPHKLFFSS